MFVWLVAFAPTWAAPKVPKSDQLRIPHEQFRLNNGLTVVVHE